MIRQMSSHYLCKLTKFFFILFRMYTEDNEMESTEILQIQEENKQENTEALVPQKLQCVSHFLAKNVCLNSNCSSYVFLCDNRSCECYKQHKGCIKGSIESINEAIEEKLTWIEPFKQRIDNLIRNAIDELSLFAERIILKAEEDLNFIGLTQNERNFIKAVRTRKVDSLTGKQMDEIFSSINNVNGFNDKMKRIQTRIDQEFDSFNCSIKKLFSRVESQLQIFSGNKSFQFCGSSIIKTEEQKKNLIAFFDRKIDTSYLIYKATQNDFRVKQFFINCKNIRNTIVICETQYGKIIGGFSNVPWDNNYYSDTTFGSENFQPFVFSLTNNDKFQLQQKRSAFRYYSDYGPMFGNDNGSDFFIGNQANNLKKAGANINNGYCNSKYKRDNTQSWQKFSGSYENFRFLVKEWQVWQLNFENQKYK